MNGNNLVKTARKYLGMNGEKFCRDYGIPFGSHWCCAFVWDIFRISGGSRYFFNGQKTAYVPTAQTWLAANCEHVKIAKAKPGDIIVFTWTGNGYNEEHGSRDHIGIIRKAGTSTVAFTIEGNTGGKTPKTSRVMERTRDARYIFGIYRPNWKPKKAAITDDNKKTGERSTKPKKPAEQTKKAAEQNAKTVKINAVYIITSKIGLNIRKAPSTAAKRLGGIAYGKRIQATKKRGDWIFIKYGKKRGWICSKRGGQIYARKV